MADYSVKRRHICGEECVQDPGGVVWHYEDDNCWTSIDDDVEKLYSETEAYADGYHDGYAAAKAEYENRKRMD